MTPGMTPTATPDGTQYDTPPPAAAGAKPPASKVVVEQRGGQFTAQCFRPGDPRPQASPLMSTFDDLVAYLGDEFAVAPPSAAPADAASAPPPSAPGGASDGDEDDY